MNEMEPQWKTEPDGLEKLLLQALRRVDAPAGFAERLVERAVLPAQVSEARPFDKLRAGNGAPASGMAPAKAKVLSFPRPRSVWMSGAIAAALLVGTFFEVDMHRQQERVRADQQFALSMQIEEQAMEHTRQQLQRAGVPLD